MISLKNDGNSFIYLQMLLDITMRFKSLYQRKKHALKKKKKGERSYKTNYKHCILKSRDERVSLRKTERTN